MGRKGRTRGDDEFAADDFANRDLLLGLPEGTGATKNARSTPSGGSPRKEPTAQGKRDDTIREILATVRNTDARIEAMAAAPRAGNAAEALAAEAAELWRAIEEARRAITSAADRAAGRREEAASANKAVSDAAAKLTAEGTSLNRRLAEVAAKANAVTERQLRLCAGTEAAAGRLGSAAEELERRKTSFRLHLRLYGLLLLLAVCASLVMGAMVQRETGIANFGNPRHEWGAFVLEHYAPILAACGKIASTRNEVTKCIVRIAPSLPVTIPPSDLQMVDAPSDGALDPAADR